MSTLQNRRRFITSSLLAGIPLITPKALAKTKYKWKMVTTWPKNFPGLGTGANYLAKSIEELSQGEMQIKVYGAGELVPALGIFDAVKRNTAQMGHGAAYYWKGKMEASQFFAAVPFGLNAQEMSAWIQYGGGQKLWDELYSSFGLKAYLCGNTGVQMGGWFNKEIKTIKDFKGLKMRMPGLGGDVLRAFECTVLSLPGGEIFQALKTGTIDATEWVGPYNDMAFGLHKAAKFYYWPGWHEPGTGLELILNKKELEKLPKHLQDIIRHACIAAEKHMLNEFVSKNAISLSQLIQKHKVVLKKFPDPVLKQLSHVSNDLLHQMAKKDPMSQKVFQSFHQFRKASISYNQITEEAYSLARALK